MEAVRYVATKIKLNMEAVRYVATKSKLNMEAVHSTGGEELMDFTAHSVTDTDHSKILRNSFLLMPISMIAVTVKYRCSILHNSKHNLHSFILITRKNLSY
jgi:hypothetical protein